MTSLRELRAAILENRAQLQAALHGAAARWETTPPANSGDEAWSPRQVAEHMIGAEWYFTNNIAQACGAPAMERPALDVSSPAAAAATVTRVGATCDNILRHVSEQDLAKGRAIGQFGTQTVEWMLATMDGHSRDHLQQLKAAASG
ncbi:MAG TPA: DinB family protein [Dehalococcoidia bacterium]|nr:DinB family protein [Dehalococcoidia bacterium]